jgi:endopeptidase La
MKHLTIDEYKLKNIRFEYKKYSKILRQYSIHIQECYKHLIINIDERNLYLCGINDLLRRMNQIYNNNMLELHVAYDEDYDEHNCSNDCSDKSTCDRNLSTLFPLLQNDQEVSFESVQSLVDICKLLKVEFADQKDQIIFDQVFQSPFSSIHSEILKTISKQIGFPSIKLAMELISGPHWSKIYSEKTKQLIDMYNDIFVPITYKLQKGNKKEIIVSKIDPITPVLLDDCAKIIIKKSVTPIVSYSFSGYFKHDCLNMLIRTSQICYPHIFQRRKTLETKIDKNCYISEDFKRSYLKNLSVRDILVLSNDEFVEMLKEDHKLYEKISKLNFMNLMKEFIKETNSLYHMFKMMRLLLFGPEININVAGLLFNLTQDKKVGSQTVADLIFCNLTYFSQIKLKKALYNVEKELDRIKTLTVDDVDLKKQVAICRNMPEVVKRAALDKIEEMSQPTSEYYKQHLYVKTLLNFPWPGPEEDMLFKDIGQDTTKSKGFMEQVTKKLDGKVYGHKKCKESVQQLIAQWLSNPASSGNAIGLLGPPGVGKTLIAKSIGDALGLPFVQIALGGQNDGEILHGHGYTYSGSQPGMIIKKMVEAGRSRCVMYFDELDKACPKHDSNEIFNILIHMTDPNMNEEFQDRFFQEITFPLNKVIFVFSYNDASTIDTVLLDRITEIDVAPFTQNDKLIIAKKFLLKEISDKIGIQNGSINIGSDEIAYIESEYTVEAGVRDLKRKIESLFLKLNMDRLYQQGIFKNGRKLTPSDPIEITKKMIVHYLDKPTSSIQEIHKEDKIGVVNGLYATVVGRGGIVPIQIYENKMMSDERFTLKLTGCQGKIMKESVISAFTASMNYIRDDIRDIYIDKHPFGFHIHTPSGAVPKDGPSAGCAFSTGFISQILRKKVKCDVAMTGEVELTGKVTKIGGLHYKLTGAKKAGVKIALVSNENKNDLAKIRKDDKGLFKDNFKVILVNNLKDVFKVALVDFDSSVLSPNV